MKDLDYQLLLLKENIKSTQEVLRNYLFVRSHIQRFGITKEGLSIYNEDDNLANELGISLTSNAKSIALEAISEKINAIKDKLKEKWEKFKSLFEKKKEDTRDKFEKLIDELKEYEDKIKNKDYQFDDTIIIDSVNYNDMKKVIDFVVKLHTDLSSEGLLKKTKKGFLWIDLTAFKDRLKSIGCILKEFKTDSEPKGFEYVYKPIELKTKEAVLKTLGYNLKNINELITIFSQSCINFKKGDSPYGLAMIIYGRNQETLSKFTDEEIDDMIELSYDSDYSRESLEDIGIILENIIIKNANLLIKVLNKIT